MYEDQNNQQQPNPLYPPVLPLTPEQQQSQGSYQQQNPAQASINGYTHYPAQAYQAGQEQHSSQSTHAQQGQHFSAVPLQHAQANANQQYQPVQPQHATTTYNQQAKSAASEPSMAFTPHRDASVMNIPEKKQGRGIAFLMGLLGVIVGAAISVGALYIATSGFSFSGSVDTSNIVIEPLAEDTELAEVVAAKVTPSVVNIDVYAAPQASPLDDYFGEGTNDSSSIEQTGLGSGVILTSDGYIVTNYHVIEGADRLTVNVGDEQHEAAVVNTDPSSDLAVIKINVENLTPIEIGDSDEVSVGEWVMAVGSPFGLEKSVSTGIVSALYRSTAMQSQSGTTIYANLIQTDAAINPGNSGGALVNSKGELIGINTLINSTSGSSSGVGFALPVNYAYSIAERIINGETVEHPYIGVTVYSVDASVAEELGLTVTSGAYIDSVSPSSPAETAGLQPGDVILSLNGKRVNTSDELIIELRGYEIGSAVNLGINRSGEDIDLNVILGATGSS